jgi:N-6 DNA Methylase
LLLPDRGSALLTQTLTEGHRQCSNSAKGSDDSRRVARVSKVDASRVDLAAIVARLAGRRADRTEANVQSDLHTLLLVAPFELGDGDLRDIVLEAPASQRRRIDVEIGQTVFEVKRDLRTGNVRADAVTQLTGYVRDRAATLQQRYVGVLTDGAEWHLYHLADDGLRLVSSLELKTAAPDVERLVVWLESVLATARRITPTPPEIVRRLGATSPAHKLDALELAGLYAANRDHPEVRLKRELWAKLLTTALGTNFGGEDALFVEHTLLVATAEIIAHAVVGIDPSDPTIGVRSLLEGALFATSQVGGVVEPDFFDWVAEVPGGDRFVRTLARRLCRFEWGAVQHDVMKVLYESVIEAQTRHSLGEYYTPDWLADEVVETAVTDPLGQRVLDPACGSGTFLFHAVRRYLEAAHDAEIAGPDALRGVTRNVMGVDVHPVAVTLARVTYLLAIGIQRLQAPDRPAFSVPVYLGDSMQWGQEPTLLNSEGLTVPTDDGAQLFADQLRFPERLMQDAGQFDRLVAELAAKASQRRPGAAIPSLAATFRLFAVHPDDQATVEQTFATMCRLSDEGRDHVWGYYVRNLARPIWLATEPNRVDVLVGNPPWLAFRHMPAGMQATFRQMSADRGMWTGASVATHQDLSALFVVRSIELYLRKGGRFGFIMPLAALSRRQFAGFRKGSYEAPGHTLSITFNRPWDLHLVKPSFFPVPASVIFGERTSGQGSALTSSPESWSGRLPIQNASRTIARQYLRRSEHASLAEPRERSPYAKRFAQGATLVPRMLITVEDQRAQPLGAGAGRRAVQSRRSMREKRPWRDLPALKGTVERQFVRRMHLGETMVSYRCLDPWLVVVPWDGVRLLDGGDPRIDMYPGLAKWWREAEAIWIEHRSSERLSFVEQIDFRGKLQQQFPAPPHRVVYTKGGMYLAAARVSDSSVIIDHKLYWASASSLDEARYLVAVLNAEETTRLVRPLQARGEHNPRDFDLYVWRLGIPLFEPANERHQELARLAGEAEALMEAMTLPHGVAFEALRRRVRQVIASSEAGKRIERLVKDMLGD